ncbi:MAG: hypothetical protein ABS876_07880 [Ruminococcus sp.]
MTQEPIVLKCRSCGGVLVVDSDSEQTILICPYCGLKELIRESDTVKVEKLRRQTEFRKWEREDRKAEEEKQERYRNGKAGKAALVFAVICGLMFAASLTQLTSFFRFSRSCFLLLQMLCFLLSYLVRKNILDAERFLPCRLPNLSAWLMTAGFLLFIPVFLCSALQSVIS